LRLRVADAFADIKKLRLADYAAEFFSIACSLDLKSSTNKTK